MYLQRLNNIYITNDDNQQIIIFYGNCNVIKLIYNNGMQS